MDVADLISLRDRCRLTQTGMARAMGLSLRAYQDIEAQDGNAELGDRHRLLAERCSLTMAVRHRDVMMALPAIRREAQDLMEIFRAERVG